MSFLNIKGTSGCKYKYLLIQLLNTRKRDLKFYFCKKIIDCALIFTTDGLEAYSGAVKSLLDSFFLYAQALEFQILANKLKKLIL
jgi:hypothetical protein